MSNDKKVAQERKEKVKKEKQELFEKVCLCMISNPAHPLNFDYALRITEEIYTQKKGIKA
jgi:hypothetical protein